MALVLLLLAGALLPGCGGTGSDPAGDGSGRASTTPLKRVVESHQVLATAVAACKQGADMGTWLSQEDKEALYRICNHGFQRGLTEIKLYGLEVCTEVAYTSPAKNAKEKARLFAACYAPTKANTVTMR